MESVQIRSFFWSVISRIRTEYRDLLRKSPYSVPIWENTDQKKLRIWTIFTQCLRICSYLLKKSFSRSACDSFSQKTFISFPEISNIVPGASFRYKKNAKKRQIYLENCTWDDIVMLAQCFRVTN